MLDGCIRIRREDTVLTVFYHLNTAPLVLIEPVFSGFQIRIQPCGVYILRLQSGNIVGTIQRQSALGIGDCLFQDSRHAVFRRYTAGTGGGDDTVTQSRCRPQCYVGIGNNGTAGVCIITGNRGIRCHRQRATGSVIHIRDIHGYLIVAIRYNRRYSIDCACNPSLSVFDFPLKTITVVFPQSPQITYGTDIRRSSRRRHICHENVHGVRLCGKFSHIGFGEKNHYVGVVLKIAASAKGKRSLLGIYHIKLKSRTAFQHKGTGFQFSHIERESTGIQRNGSGNRKMPRCSNFLSRSLSGSGCRLDCLQILLRIGTTQDNFSRLSITVILSVQMKIGILVEFSQGKSVTEFNLSTIIGREVKIIIRPAIEGSHEIAVFCPLVVPGKGDRVISLNIQTILGINGTTGHIDYVIFCSRFPQVDRIICEINRSIADNAKILIGRINCTTLHFV